MPDFASSLFSGMLLGMTCQPLFTVGEVPVYGDVILAPLAGFSEPPYRQLCREFGSAMSYTELLDARAMHHKSGRTEEMVSFEPWERPRVGQIFGHEPPILAEAAQALVALDADMIDLNLGCAVRKIVQQGHGAALLQTPRQIGRIIERLVQAVPVPVTAKMRLGWDADSRTYLEVAHVLEESGAALIAVHGRTAQQSYLEPADWDAIAEVKQAITIPVIGNGDVVCVADIARMKAHTGCDAVMVGRAAIGNPWIFQGRELADVALAERVQVMQRHFEMLVEHHGAWRGVMHFRKHMGRYVRGLPNSGALRHTLIACQTAEALRARLRELEQST